MSNVNDATEPDSTTATNGSTKRPTAPAARHVWEDASSVLGDYTVTPRVIMISLIAIVLGLCGTSVAWILVRFIGLVTNLVYFQRLGTDLVSPAGNHLGLLAIAVPIAGALVVGVMARYGSEKIRGDGVPEAIEAVLVSGSRVEPKVAALKPISAAIAIGTGSPFGAEGPIIMTGGAIGSLVAQSMRMTSGERKTLLAAGAAAGMAAIFAAPVAGVLLAVEVLLFEFKPRSLIPVALAAATAGFTRTYVLGSGAVFPAPSHPGLTGVLGFLGCMFVGLVAGLLSALLTLASSRTEYLFQKLPVHWMWWPAIGAVAVGVGGLFVPETLGVGYGTIAQLLQGNVAISLVVGIFVVKAVIWTIALSSGSSGGVFAPVFMIGAALGSLEALFLPHEGPGFWALLSMGATLGGIYRSPLTGVVFTLETTHDLNALLPLLIAVFMAYGVMSLVLRRSILTEKLAQRGYHIRQEFAVDPLEMTFVGQIMRTNVTALPAGVELATLAPSIHGREPAAESGHRQGLYPVVDEHRALVGVVTREDLVQLIHDLETHPNGQRLADALRTSPVVAYPDEPVRAAADRMAETGLTRLPVVSRSDPQTLIGMISINEVLAARQRALLAERERERILRIRLHYPGRARHRPSETPPAGDPPTPGS
ncbi:MAG TPA: chloride channel protein [Thermomicrobiaceae bacterium]|nr:chloride channel protein [Thermomicrobiaceae bacterium]